MNIVWKAVRYMAAHGLVFGAVLGALYGTILFLVFFPLGALYGAFYGGMAGLFAGAACGLLIGVLTIYCFYPLTDPPIYRRVLTICGAFCGFCGALLGFVLLFHVPIEDLINEWPDYRIIIILPSLIAAAYVSRGFATGFVAEKRQKKEKSRREQVYI
jgi:hypothetical protein